MMHRSDGSANERLTGHWHLQFDAASPHGGAAPSAGVFVFSNPLVSERAGVSAQHQEEGHNAHARKEGPD